MSVKVAVRVRPFNQREKDLKCQCCVQMQTTTTRLKASKTEPQKDFTFDYSFWSFDQYDTQQNGYMKPNSTDKYADQDKVYKAVGKSVLDNAFQGYHCCLFAYGQTGSGKSYSMIGYGVNRGIVPITCNQIFNKIAENKGKGVQYQVTASMLEIYNEQIQDLTINPKQKPAGGLKVRENKLLGVYVDGVKKHFVTSFKEIEGVMESGTKNRTVAATQMNATSSRAHTIITIQFKQIQKVGDTKTEKVSMINLVDLAGSQRQDKTGATGQRLKQAVGINQSLTSLGQVISVLAQNAQGKNNFVPYRNSALTRILQNALGGNSQTIMVCAISPANDNYDETLSTLRYAERAKKIKNKPIVNETESDKLIRELKSENQRLKKLLQQRAGNVNVQTGLKKQEPKNDKPVQKQVQKQVEKPSEKKIQNATDHPVQKKAETQLQKPHNQPEQKKNQKPQQKKAQNTNQHNQAPHKNDHGKKQVQSDDSDSDDDDLEAKVKLLEQLLQNQKKSAAQKAQQARKDQQALLQGMGSAFGSIFKGNQIAQMKKKGQKPPPYLQNISKDVMIDRKIKIFIDKPVFLVGRDRMTPENDLVLGGRDVQGKQAQIRVLGDKVFVKGIGHHVYVNGRRLQSGQTLELAHLDRVVFGWNSVFLFKNRDPNTPVQDKYLGKFIDWWFVKTELMQLVDIDQSDTEDGGCCQIY